MTTTKGKAEELVNRFSVDVFSENKGWYTSIEESKDMAKSVVDEIVMALKITTGHCELRKIDAIEVKKDFQFWQEVKQEIESI